MYLLAGAQVGSCFTQKAWLLVLGVPALALYKAAPLIKQFASAAQGDQGAGQAEPGVSKERAEARRARRAAKRR